MSTKSKMCRPHPNLKKDGEKPQPCEEESTCYATPSQTSHPQKSLKKTKTPFLTIK